MVRNSAPYLSDSILVPPSKVELFFLNMIIKEKTAPPSKVAPFSKTAPTLGRFGSAFFSVPLHWTACLYEIGENLTLGGQVLTDRKMCPIYDLHKW